MTASRRGFLLGLGAALAAPAVVRAESLMKIAVLRQPLNEAVLQQVLDNIVMYEHWPDGFMRGVGWLVIPQSNGEIVRRLITHEEFYDA